MSEHMAVEGKCDFYHMPEDEPWGFSYCNRCKKIKHSLRIELHQGISNDWIKVLCPGCKKTMWVANLTTDKDEHPKCNGGKFIPKDDKKCFVCKKPTNHFDAECITYRVGRKAPKREKYFCSKKCVEIDEKIEMKKKKR